MNRTWVNFLATVVILAVAIPSALAIRGKYIGLINSQIYSQEVITDPLKPTSTSLSLPTSFSQDVLFTDQAPLDNWDIAHEDASEEASLLMVKHNQAHQAFGSPATVEAEIQELIDWETTHDYRVNLTLAELEKIATVRYNLTGRIIEKPSIAEIQQAITKGHLVIVPTAAQVLANPHFNSADLTYHLLVITGYDPTGFITNDPGTKLGEGYHYDYNNLMDSIHDWDSTDIMKGSSRVLVF